jgi:hypothetical protein
MDCSKYQPQFTAFLDGDLTPQETVLLRVHLKECLTCYRKWNSLQKTQEILSLLPELDPPEHLGALVMARVKDRHVRQQSWLFACLHRWLPLGVGVAAVLFISVTLWRTIPSDLSRQSQESDSQERTMMKGATAEQPPASFTATQRSYGSGRPVMVLRVKDFSRVHQELESMLRSFSRSMVRERGPVGSVRSSSARLIDVQVPGKQFSNLIRELDKIGHLDHSQLESHKATSRDQRKAISIRLVVISNGTESETWLKVESNQQAEGSSSTHSIDSGQTGSPRLRSGQAGQAGQARSSEQQAVGVTPVGSRK